MTTIACLPPALLWAAQFAASTDSTKGPLCAVEARQSGSKLRLAAVDGYRAFRCFLPLVDGFFLPEEPIRLQPKAFSKAPSRKAVKAEFDDGGIVSFKDKNGLVVGSTVWTADPWALSEQDFPNLDQLWPTELSCKPGTFVAFNAAYLADFMKIADRLANNSVVKMYSQESPVAPIAWQAMLDKSWLGDGEEIEEDIVLDYLVMPVQVRGQ